MDAGERSPLLRTTEDDRGDGASHGRFKGVNLIVFAVFAAVFLALYGSDFLGGDARWSRTTTVGRNEWNALALSPEFVNRINADGTRTWTAHVPAGWEDASHRDLRRIAGGRLSDEPKDRRLWVRSEFSSDFSSVVAGPASDEATVTGTVTHETSEAAAEDDERGATTTENPVAVAESRRGPREEGALGRVKASSAASSSSSSSSDSAISRPAPGKTRSSRKTSRSSDRPAPTRSSPNASPKRLVPSLSRKGQRTRGADADSSLGGFIQDFLGPAADQTSAPAFNPKALGLPESFDARTKWSQCAHLIGVARDQGNCGSCWAMAPAEVMSDRACIQSDGKVNAELSPFQLLACSSGSFGCEGGESADAYEFAKSNGVVTGGAFDDAKTCAPYPFAPCHHPCEVFPTPACPATCVESSGEGGVVQGGSFKVKSIVDCPSFDYGCVANEIYHNGPVSSYAGDIYEEFYAYKSGVFRESSSPAQRGANHGGHVVKVIGWGKADPAKGEGEGYYWIVVNSWLNWGDDGVGRIAVGEVGIGAGVESAVMDV
uniref:Peptidase C1A papain C-terminal domain-containing protein n=1 Tax=Micromonas pusilla TaxID=38833 RepID=A0A7S0PT73_MICPS|mmetsp:Transcript_9392/g.36543  ORF Transcript_9392/g.36543 Transcript_9392/m.36543 type:complete len:546 (+) Transcript_9392:66-1703(+)